MKSLLRAKRWVAVFGVVALATAGAFFVLYRETLLEAWYLTRLDADRPKTREEARRSLVRLASAKAVPRLLTADEEMPANTEAVKRILERLGGDRLVRLAELLQAEDDPLYLRVVALHKETDTPQSSLVPFLRRTMKHENPGLRRYAAEELSRMTPAPREALAELVQAQSDEDEDVRFWATLAVRHIDPTLVRDSDGG